MFDTFIQVFGSGIRLGVPLILACLAGLWSERSGVVDIGLEGKILAGAFAAAAFATVHRQRLARAARRRRRDDRGLARPRLRLDRPARQPDRLGHGDQHGRRRPHRADRQRHLVAGRPHAANCRSRRCSTRSRCPCRQFRHGADRRLDLPAPDLRPRHRHLRRLRLRAAHLLGALQHAVRAPPARGRRESGGGRHRGHFGARPALQRGDHLRRAGRALAASISRSPRPPISSRT